MKKFIKFFELLILLALAGNLVAVGSLLHDVEANYMQWVNLFGCVVFGAHLSSVLRKT